MFFINESATYRRPNIIELKKYRGVIIGEVHSRSMIEYYRELIKELKPEYFISEFAHEDQVFTQEALADRLSKTTNGKFLPNIPDYQDNFWVYELAYYYGVKLIGCDLEAGRWLNADQEMRDRETFMLDRIDSVNNRKFICQIGDFHLRSIPIDEKFYKATGTNGRDETGTRGYPINVHFASPIYEAYKDTKYVIISRDPNNYMKELKYIKATRQK